jgi:hypothetical protein
MLLLLASVRAVGEDAGSPHEMIGADGKADATKCNVCHNDDLTLTLSKTETCTLCHSPTLHAGAQEHLRADAARVARVVPPPKDGGTALPLTEEGRIYCGTCHVFHDPRVSDEPVLDRNWVPSTRLADAIRESLTVHVEAAATGTATGATLKFGDGTKRLRLPIADGSLCRRCHPYGK